jgi:hypothetical protein
MDNKTTAAKETTMTTTTTTQYELLGAAIATSAQWRSEHGWTIDASGRCVKDAPMMIGYGCPAGVAKADMARAVGGFVRGVQLVQMRLNIDTGHYEPQYEVWTSASYVRPSERRVSKFGGQECPECGERRPNRDCVVCGGR